MLCLMPLVKGGDHEELEYEEEWTGMLDRGGLWYIKDTTYSLFLAIEEETRQCLKLLVTQHERDH